MSEKNGAKAAIQKVLPMDVALAGLLAVRGGDGETDDFDALVMESEEETPLSIDRVTLGKREFETPSIDGESMDEYAKTIDCIMVLVTTARDFYPGSEDNSPALCLSIDGVHGIVQEQGLEDKDMMQDAEESDARHPYFDNPHRRVFKCATCALNQWGTGRNGRGKACKEKRQLLAMPDERNIPIGINIPATSIRTLEKYQGARMNRTDKAWYLVRTRLGVQNKSEGGNSWGVLTMENLGVFTKKNEKGEEVLDVDKAKAVLAYQKSARAAYQNRLNEVLAEAQEREQATGQVIEA